MGQNPLKDGCDEFDTNNLLKGLLQRLMVGKKTNLILCCPYMCITHISVRPLPLSCTKSLDTGPGVYFRPGMD